MSYPNLKDVAVVCPTFVKVAGEVDNLARLQELATHAGELHIVAQGCSPGGVLPSSARVYYTAQGRGTWGSQLWALEGAGMRQALEESDQPYVLVLLNPVETVQNAEDLARRCVEANADHAQGARADIAGALSAKPEVGTARAIAECWLTTAALIALNVEPGVVLDGFSGFLTLRREIYLDPARWTWMKGGTVNWGGAAMAWILSIQEGRQVVWETFSHSDRTLPSRTFTEEASAAVSQMLRNVVVNGFFTRHVGPDQLTEAARRVIEFFPNQSCFSGKSPEEVAAIIDGFLADFEVRQKQTFLDM